MCIRDIPDNRPEGSYSSVRRIPTCATPSGRAGPGRAGGRPAARLRDRRGAVGARRRPARPADGCRLPGAAPAGATRPAVRLVAHDRRPGTPHLRAHPGRPARAGRRARRPRRRPAGRGGAGMTTAAHPRPPGPSPGDEHVAALGRALRGPGKAGRSIVREVRDGLEDAVDAYRRAGFDAPAAACLAVRDFGHVPEVAPLYQDELTAGQGRRTALLLVIGVPALVLGWDLLWSSGLAVATPGPPAVKELARVQDIAGVIAAAIAAVLVVLTSRRSTRPRRAALAAAATAVATVVVCGGAAVAMAVVNGPLAWQRITSQPAGAFAYLVSAMMVVLMN